MRSLAALCAALLASFALLWEHAHPGHSRAAIAAGPVALYLTMAAGSVLYARPAPP